MHTTLLRTSRPTGPTARLRAGAAALLAAAALALGTGSAAAHIGVMPSVARPATNETFMVRVPTERDEPTIRVRVELPDGLVVSRFQPKPGWQRQVERDSAGRITAATWSGGAIGDGEFDDFVFIARTPAQEGKLAFKSYQTYQSGETIEWVNEGGTSRPAAIVDVRAATTAAGATDDHGQAQAVASATAPGGGSGGTAAATARSGAGAGSSDAAAAGSDLPLFVALGAGALALMALALAMVTLSRRPAAV